MVVVESAVLKDPAFLGEDRATLVELALDTWCEGMSRFCAFVRVC